MSEQILTVRISLKGPADTKIKLDAPALQKALQSWWNGPNYAPYEITVEENIYPVKSGLMVPIGEKRLERQIVIFCVRCKQKTIHSDWVQGKHLDATYRHCYQCGICGRLEQWGQPADRKLPLLAKLEEMEKEAALIIPEGNNVSEWFHMRMQELKQSLDKYAGWT